MLRRTFQIQALLVCLTLMSCSHGQYANQTSSAFSIVVVGSVQDDSISAIEDSLTRHIPRVSAYLGIAQMPHYVVKVWEDPAKFRSVFENEGGRGGVSQGYVNVNRRKREVRVLDHQGVESVAVHEATHLAISQLNPTIAASAFWL